MEQSHRGLLIVLGVLVLVAVLVPMLGVGMMGPGMVGPGMMGGYGGSGGWPWGLAMGLGMLAMLAFWGAIVVGIVLLVRWATGAAGHSGGPASESALEILKRRYAAGEITREEYEQMRALLHE